jgi:glycosyltransferase 2 family protein
MTSSRRQRWSQVSSIAIGIAISAGFVHLLLSKVDLARVGREIATVDVAVLSLCLGSSLLGFLAMTGRSAVLLRPLHDYGRWRLFLSVLVGFAGNAVLPLRMGELLRVDYLARHGGCAHSSCLAVLAVERLLDLVCLVLLFFALLPVAAVEMPRASVFAGVGAAVASALLVLFLIARDRRRFTAAGRWLSGWLGERASLWIAARAERFAAGLRALESASGVAAACALSGAYWLSMLLGIRIALAAFDLTLPWYAPAVILVFVTFGVALPSAPAFLGTYHYFAVLALTVMGVEAERAVSFAVVFHAVGFVPFTLVSLVLLAGEVVGGKGRPAADGAEPGSRDGP